MIGCYRKFFFSLRFGTQTFETIETKIACYNLWFSTFNPTIICQNPVVTRLCFLLTLFCWPVNSGMLPSSTAQFSAYSIPSSTFRTSTSSVLALACNRLRSLHHASWKHYARCLKPHWTLQRKHRVMAHTISIACKQVAHATGYTMTLTKMTFASVSMWMGTSWGIQRRPCQSGNLPLFTRVVMLQMFWNK
jgi:hypothetical protein